MPMAISTIVTPKRYVDVSAAVVDVDVEATEVLEDPPFPSCWSPVESTLRAANPPGTRSKIPRSWP